MSARDTTQEIGVALETVPETSLINAADALYWKLGYKTNKMIDKHPSKIQEWRPIYKDGLFNPADSELPINRVGGKYSFVPTNGWPLYLILGESSSDASFIHTLSNINPGTSLPSFTLRSESRGGSYDKFREHAGCKATGLNGMINFANPSNRLTEILTYNAIKLQTATLNSAHDGSQHPTNDYTMTGTERKDRYKLDTNTLFSWDSNDIIAHMLLFNYNIIMSQDVVHIDGQADTEFIDEGNYQLLFSLAAWRGPTNVDQMFTDFEAGNQKTMIFTIYNGASTYRTMTFTKATILQCEWEYATAKGDKIWNIQGYAEDLGIVTDDNISNQFYGDADP